MGEGIDEKDRAHPDPRAADDVGGVMPPESQHSPADSDDGEGAYEGTYGAQQARRDEKDRRRKGGHHGDGA